LPRRPLTRRSGPDGALLSFAQWSICIGIAASLVVVEELIKLVIRRRERASVGEEEPVDRATRTLEQLTGTPE
jgi:hypothetical protein